jgi:hypothetical protein
MRAKFINEEFKEKSDPIKDMDIGIKNFKDYVSTRFKSNKRNIEKFWYWFKEGYITSKSDEEILEELLEILEHTPLEYQIDWMDAYLDYYIEED